MHFKVLNKSTADFIPAASTNVIFPTPNWYEIILGTEMLSRLHSYDFSCYFTIQKFFCFFFSRNQAIADDALGDPDETD